MSRNQEEINLPESAAAGESSQPLRSSDTVVVGPNQLPNTVVEHSKHFDFSPLVKALEAYAQGRVSKTTQGLFKSDKLQMMADNLLQLVMQGQQDEADAILKSRPYLLRMPGTATDHAGVKYTGTAYEYASDALDKSMCKMLESYFDGADLDIDTNARILNDIKQGP